MQDVVVDIVARRRDRAIAVILGIKEREVDRYLPAEASTRLRKTILDQLNDLHAFFVDVMKSYGTDDVVLNELYLQKLDDVHRDVELIREQLVSS